MEHICSGVSEWMYQLKALNEAMAHAENTALWQRAVSLANNKDCNEECSKKLAADAFSDALVSMNGQLQQLVSDYFCQPWVTYYHTNQPLKLHDVFAGPFPHINNTEVSTSHCSNPVLQQALLENVVNTEAPTACTAGTTIHTNTVPATLISKATVTTTTDFYRCSKNVHASVVHTDNSNNNTTTSTTPSTAITEYLRRSASDLLRLSQKHHPLHSRRTHFPALPLIVTEHRSDQTSDVKENSMVHTQSCPVVDVLSSPLPSPRRHAQRNTYSPANTSCSSDRQQQHHHHPGHHHHHNHHHPHHSHQQQKEKEQVADVVDADAFDAPVSPLYILPTPPSMVCMQRHCPRRWHLYFG